jgi:hypothetical protein
MNKQSILEIDSQGNKLWRLNGVLHREDGPAIEYPNGDKLWLFNGKLHRENGPAIIYACGDKEWWLNDYFYSHDGWFNLLTSEQQYNYLWSLDE